MANNSPELLPPIHLPPIQNGGEKTSSSETTGVQYNSAGEKTAAQGLEQGVTTGSPPLPLTQTQAPVADDAPLPSPPAQQKAQPQVPTDDHPAIADDADLIEKEWVDKAKEIVTRTSQDPYTQNKEITRMKADYLKKRYNKDVKVSEDN